jgi:hypothetical protein
MYIYLILHGYVKQYKYIKMLFLPEEGRFHNAFEDKPAKWPIAKKETTKIYTHN